jgi:hypothetical protein
MNDTYTITRRSLHGVAELLLAGPQYRTTGKLALRVTPGGFATTAGALLGVDGTLLVRAEEVITGLDGVSYFDLALLARVVPGAPKDLYHDGSGASAQDIVRVDPAEASRVMRAFAVGDRALRQHCPDQEPVLWPEHFDVAVTEKGITYGVSPGDGHLAKAYAYVSVPASAQRGASFWNMPFGAARPLSWLGSAAAIARFFAAGRDLAHAA